ncbi:hypothetical protein FVEN_g6573 [Fusarium venenatum]|uniref:Uncharacterized protein n=1 Tax=Fusarium venenatum TaxID=56646 RepID=A0A2L2SVB3_9HYPO|nr:uncharacterized protein FVRRES_04874 [Fusarium venenatum]KAG8355779.1 hypothetical protein FVEN_g6573 [Fusarium venenatum]CEI60438.1 unnamed protein product [Fusarium venenatum]
MGSAWHDCPFATEPDPDIAGIGVIAAFITSSCLATLSISLYLAITRSELDIISDGGFRPPGQNTRPINPIDGWARRNICVPFVEFLIKSKWIEEHIERLNRVLYSFIMTLVDTQLVLGIAMLIAATIKLHRNSISVYHFTMVTNLAWLTSGVHLMATYVIRIETNGSMKQGRRWIGPFQDPSDHRSWSRKTGSTFALGADMFIRVLSMLLMVALLLYCIYVSGSEGWDYNYDRLASCAMGRKKAGTPLAWMIATYVLVLHGYIIRCLSLWPAASIWWIDTVRPSIIDDRALEAQLSKKRLPWWRLIWTSIHYAINSELLGVCIDGLLWFGLGIWWIQADRVEVQKWVGMEAESDVEGFGQLVPILIVGAPFVQALQTYCEQSRTARRERQRSNAERGETLRLVLCVGGHTI